MKTACQPSLQKRRAQSSKSRWESNKKTPILNEAIASLLRARSVPALGREHGIVSPMSPRSPCDTEPRWQKHASRLKQMLAETDCELVAENTFISVSPNGECKTQSHRSRSMPAEVDDGRDKRAARSGTATPEPWERVESQDQSFTPYAQEGHGFPMQGVHCVQLTTSDSSDLVRWLMENAVSSATRIAALEERVAHLELLNTQLHAAAYLHNWRDHH